MTTGKGAFGGIVTAVGFCHVVRVADAVIMTFRYAAYMADGQGGGVKGERVVQGLWLL